MVKWMCSKKGVSLWLSWVLLLAFVVALSAFMFQWAESRNEQLVSDLKIMSDTAECNYVGIRVEDICQNPQTLYINISNKNSIKISQVVFNIYDVYLDNPLSKAINVSINPSEVESLRVLKQSTTQQLDIVPVIFTEDDKVFCYKKTVSVDSVEYCS